MKSMIHCYKLFFIICLLTISFAEILKPSNDKYDIVKNVFKEADDTLNFSISKLILEGPKEELDLTANTQPAIFLISYSTFKVAKNEFNLDLNSIKQEKFIIITE